MSIYACSHENRRDVIRGLSGVNGLDYLEVREDPITPADLVGQPARILQADLEGRLLEVYFINAPAPALAPDNFRLDGGERLRGLVATSVDPGLTPESLFVAVDKQGDLSNYTLTLVAAAGNPEPPSGIDRVVRRVEFSFHVRCAGEFDCAAEPDCPLPFETAPDIDLTARDYDGFRRTMLDRLSTLGGRWGDRHVADPGVALVELLAYVGDRVSYRQDAIATESYLGTARRRISARRHARLLDYAMHDGANARAGVRILCDASSNGQTLAGPDASGLGGTRILSRLPGVDSVLAPGSSQEHAALNRHPVVFETLHDITLHAAHASMDFYTWGETECRLLPGATSATLEGDFPQLAAGDLLIFVEKLGPHTGNPQDADPAKRHMVRLTSVVPRTDPLGGLLQDPPVATPVAVTEIEWSQEDALPFGLCLSARTDLEHGDIYLPHVCAALGNVVLCDHGHTLEGAEALGAVPSPKVRMRPARNAQQCADESPLWSPPRFRPVLAYGPLTQVTRQPIPGTSGGTRPFDPKSSAASALVRERARAVPALELIDDLAPAPRHWTPRRDLLGSGDSSTDFVVEVDETGLAHLRFGDGAHGLAPAVGTSFRARYRVGNGEQGNVGQGALGTIVTTVPGIHGVENPLPAVGGQDPESVQQVRDRAPVAFRTQRRAVTEEDYAKAAKAFPGVQNAAATFRWTGSWTTVFLTVDRLRGLDVDDEFRQTLRLHLDRLRMAGHDLEIEGPLYVPLELSLSVCVDDEHFRTDVEKALRRVFTSGFGPDGQPGLFHPDRYTFGQSVFTSAFLAAATSVDGVSHAEVTLFRKQGEGSDEALQAGRLDLGRLQVARLENNPNFPDRGVFRLKMLGGK